ncbi:MAG TPA: STAS domain-containing protein [Polyangia bacterium]|jgi:anti-sigma B factor antagonist|nr:STAS domain-containing protein [Polyangia bacterium]
MEILVGRSEDGGETRVFIEGVLDAVTVSEVRPSLEAVVARQPRRVVVDLSRLRLIDSCGVGVLVAIYKKARANDCGFALTGACQQPLAILKLLNLDRVLSMDGRSDPISSSAINNRIPTPVSNSERTTITRPVLIAAAS